MAQNGKRYGADAPIGFRLLRRRGRFEIGVGDGDAAVVLLNTRHLGIVTDEVADFFRKSLADHVHAADRLKHRGLKTMPREILQVQPQPRLQDVGQIDRLARDRQRSQAAAGVLRIATKLRGDEICLVGIVAVERAPVF